MTTDPTTAPTISNPSSSNRPKIAGGITPETPFPIKMSGTVIKGFGRGSKDLGIPTANLPEEAIAAQEEKMVTGIYYGWAQVVVRTKPEHSSGLVASERSIAESASSSTSSLATHCPATVHPMVMSLGWNPFYKNEKKSAEVHIMHNFHRDFYGDELRVIVLGYIRPEFDYTTLEALIEDINIDIEVAHRSLERPDYAAYKEDPIFLQL
ncbi:riboflavin kinase [Entomortierella chlamydospora]|uniref:Riboflavin kinase n=1 Tax=Entomortierella chlamydospora TaxID=101097 RepID=A0A9P6N0V0_9FUNG|nr:riboflavin kinase [Entomortierella chlamydospora]KAG0019552.1 riboflavin kinase [Entomortierella chlamydospora]